jgi:hypothetical protein
LGQVETDATNSGSFDETKPRKVIKDVVDVVGVELNMAERSFGDVLILKNQRHRKTDLESATQKNVPHTGNPYPKAGQRGARRRRVFWKKIFRAV